MRGRVGPPSAGDRELLLPVNLVRLAPYASSWPWAALTVCAGQWLLTGMRGRQGGACPAAISGCPWMGLQVLVISSNHQHLLELKASHNLLQATGL